MFQRGEFLRNENGICVPVEWINPLRRKFGDLYNVEVVEYPAYFVGGGPRVVLGRITAKAWVAAIRGRRVCGISAATVLLALKWLSALRNGGLDWASEK